MRNPSGRRISLRGVRAFCAAARHSTLRHAADELFLTPSAVSHQIKNLEAELGVALFERVGRGLELTEAGETFYREASPALVRLEAAAASLQASQSKVSLLVSAQPFFASELLFPSLQDFSDVNPKIEVNIDASDESTDLDSFAVDVSIRLYKRPPADLQTHMLFPLTLLAACSPALLDQAIEMTTGGEASVPFIIHSSRTGAWRQWATQCGVQLPDTTSVVRLDSMSAIVQAAERGVGLALIPSRLTEQAFRDGRLMRFFDHELETGEAYYIAFREDNHKLNEIRLFADWVLQTLGERGFQDR